MGGCVALVGRVDQFQKNGGDIYHIYFITHTKNQVEKSGSMPVPFLPSLKASYPEIKYGTRYMNGAGIVDYDNKKINENVRYSDAPIKVPAVVKDFNFQSLHQPIKPLSLILGKDFPFIIS